MVIRRAPAAPLAGRVTTYYGFELETPEPVRQREGPGHRRRGHPDVRGALADRRRAAYVLRRRAARPAGDDRASGPLARHAGQPRSARRARSRRRAAPRDRAPDRAARADSRRAVPRRAARRGGLGRPLRIARRDARASDRRRATLPRGRVGVAAAARDATVGSRSAPLAAELGWSRKRIVARFRDEIGLPPKAVARLLRFERARELAGTMPWGELAFECGFSDQSHLIAEFRRSHRTDAGNISPRHGGAGGLACAPWNNESLPICCTKTARPRSSSSRRRSASARRCGRPGAPAACTPSSRSRPTAAGIYLGQPQSGFRNPAVAGKTSLVYVIVDDESTAITRGRRPRGARIIEEPADRTTATGATAASTRRATSGTSPSRSRRRRRMADVVPFLGYEDCGAAADWLVRAFGFEEVERLRRERRASRT